MEVTVTVEDGDGAQSSGTADTYEDAFAMARTQIPQGSRAIVIRTDHY